MSSNTSIKYVYEIPYMARISLTRQLDHGDVWKELAGRMKYNTMTILEIEREYTKLHISPSDNLLNLWGQNIHEIRELFYLLYTMKHVTAMNILKPFVAPQYHAMISSICHYSTENNEDYPIQLQTIEKIERSEKIINKPEKDGESLQNEMLKISFADLTEATEKWNPSNMLGKGGFGVVIKGNLKNTPVAIKIAKKNQNSTKIINDNELTLLYKFRHDNVLALYGYSDDGQYFCLIYQLMVGGSLDERLRYNNKFPPLDWNQRLNIGVDVARGLQYLHTVSNRALIHGDIKSANILLDAYDNAKIGDFGLAKLGDENLSRMKVKAVHGTRPYLPNDYIKSRELSAKVDVFSFGVVLFEMATGLKAYCEDKIPAFLREYVPMYLEKNPMDYGGLEDFCLVRLNYSNGGICQKLIDVGLECVREKAEDRPKMIEVFDKLRIE